jgi:hypothetical protein
MKTWGTEVVSFMLRGKETFVVFQSQFEELNKSSQ